VSTVVADLGAPPRGKKKLIVLVAVVLLLLAIAGAAAMLLMKKNAHDEDAEEADDAPAKTVRHDPKVVPIFVPLDAFTVNLADREAERYAQVGITLEVVDAQVAERLKAYMPAIRNQILLALADRTAAQLMDRDGKARLAEQVRRVTSRAIGAEVDAEPAPAKADDEAPKPNKRRKKEAALPITAVHFSNFIIQ
jgi:flagellar FliL protein